MTGLPAHYFTPEQYLERERWSEEKHEYFEGQIILMAGGMPRHSLIINSVSAAVTRRLPEDGPCFGFNSDLRTNVHWDGLITYPDFQVVCGELEFTDDRRDTITNPTFVVEVLSPSTARHDRGRKLDYYKGCDSIREYLLIDQTPVDIEHGWRVASGGWNTETVRDLSATIRLDSIGIEIPVKEIYRGTQAIR
ncbi:MAG: Uma2 family endonuclease [Bryobacteraceae bacterium]|nr:Uma2 family endonuclease [Bryobacteraceae bacterium]